MLLQTTRPRCTLLVSSVLHCRSVAPAIRIALLVAHSALSPRDPRRVPCPLAFVIRAAYAAIFFPRRLARALVSTRCSSGVWVAENANTYEGNYGGGKRRRNPPSTPRCPRHGRRPAMGMAAALSPSPGGHFDGNTRPLAKVKWSAPGPDAVSDDILGLIGAETAEVMGTALTEWCADMGTQDLPQIWAQSIVPLIPKAGKKGERGEDTESASHRSCVGYPGDICCLHYAQAAARPLRGFGERLGIPAGKQRRGGCHTPAPPCQRDPRMGRTHSRGPIRYLGRIWKHSVRQHVACFEAEAWLSSCPSILPLSAGTSCNNC